MSVNGVCQVELSGVDTSKLTKKIIDTSKGELVKK